MKRLFFASLAVLTLLAASPKPLTLARAVASDEEEPRWHNYFCSCRQTCSPDSRGHERSGQAHISLYNASPSYEEKQSACDRDVGRPYRNSFGGCSWSNISCSEEGSGDGRDSEEELSTNAADPASDH
jgi:hypothetical protein